MRLLWSVYFVADEYLEEKEYKSGIEVYDSRDLLGEEDKPW